MSVTVEKIDLNDEAQRSDLEKIYEDSPGWMRRNLESGDFIKKWLEPCSEIWGGCYNGRIIGAVGLRETDQGLQLIGLCVREVTRRRGVAFDMMELILAKRKGKVFIETRQQPSTDILFDKLGFNKQALSREDGGITWVRWEKELS
ncbi:MAG: PanM family protein [Natronospirillum sp.]|uniref:acetyl-CoA sensor PanZ family protein n=1 Tax=Natronospirillum sp. TaxID=2812955 RepID=UPI0025E7A694|nr:acetyl-CoA sensor PanZ family protein [Natronospirillum sp.]MCH8552717.1 PanM family protein [Natronospirillum sp.]